MSWPPEVHSPLLLLLVSWSQALLSRRSLNVHSFTAYVLALTWEVFELSNALLSLKAT
jgi:hypothetical protein